MRQFERHYRIASEELFSCLKRGESRIEIDPDDLYEWRTYFDFTKEVDAEIEAFLRETPSLNEVVYNAATAGLETPKRSVKDRQCRIVQLAA